MMAKLEVKLPPQTLPNILVHTKRQKLLQLVFHIYHFI